MADDARDSTAPTPEVREPEQQGIQQERKPKHEFPKSQVGKLWDAFGNPEEPVNMLPSAGAKSGRTTKDITVTEAMKSMSLENVTSFHKAPCARDSLLLGIGAGFGVGGVRGVVGGLRSVWTACNWAVGAFAVTALAAHEFCQRRRVEELDGMKQAVELMKELKLKKQREKEQKIEEAARLAEEERKRKSWTNPSNYKFW
ncbi:cytochrome oxidase biogenesis protein, Cox20 subunit [Aspergillus sclerotioniger CBS 115572]|uniref:Cytochrome c oxidase assembly protein COX20, mitochondrial n=1 Tax=Aspergillus sclerotioniger CBS 115572 TaxID=1450535 RepID=A0A317WPH6_9EURO|nr:cytochrome oxidase biogenesis protein, Cox20 subunit [Aspergillus sclerotioniger CBS 115572]PWY87925.1 cytochrome oxidase biogenesis protein, Cox20 subunit [Aspergillus sclerotioniger CBS 115572]